jgi:hypothetical protein
MAYNTYGLNKGQEQGSAINVSAGTLDLATAIAQAGSLSTAITAGGTITAGMTTEVNALVAALGTLNSDMFLAYNVAVAPAGTDNAINRQTLKLAMGVIEDFLQASGNTYGNSLDSGL